MNSSAILPLAPFIARLAAEGNWGYPRWAEMLGVTGLNVEAARKLALASPAKTTPGRALRRIKRALRA